MEAGTIARLQCGASGALLREGWSLRKGQLNRHTRYRLPHETLPRSGRVTRWTNTPVRIFKDPAPTPIPAKQPYYIFFSERVS